MSHDRKDLVRLEMTEEQKKEIREQSGRVVDALEFTVQELEQRIAPRKAGGLQPDY